MDNPAVWAPRPGANYSVDHVRAWANYERDLARTTKGPESAQHSLAASQADRHIRRYGAHRAQGTVSYPWSK